MHSITQAAKHLGIKLSTAKLIFNKYKKYGTFFETTADRKARITQNQTII